MSKKVMVCVKSRCFSTIPFVERMESLGLELTGVGIRSLLGLIEIEKIKDLKADKDVISVERE